MEGVVAYAAGVAQVQQGLASGFFHAGLPPEQKKLTQQRFIKGESRLAVAWVGPRPVGASTTGDPVQLPEPDGRRDGSGEAVLMGPQIVGHLIERG